MISIENLHKKYGKNHVLKGIDLQIDQGEVVVILGSSGGGKSTLLRCINMTETPTSGRVWVNGIDMTDPRTNLNQVRADIGMVFQQFNLFPNMNVIDNIMLALTKVRKLSRRKARQTALEALEKVGLREKANEFPSHLSGGQKQRVAISRAMAMQPKVLLFDEPTSALDPEMVDEVLAVIRKLASTGITMVIVTHEMSFARDVASRIIFLDGGKIIEDGTPEKVIKHSRHAKVRSFFEALTN